MGQKQSTAKGPFPWCFGCQTFSHVLEDCPTTEPRMTGWVTSGLEGVSNLDEFLLHFQRQTEANHLPLQMCQRCCDLNFPYLLRKPFTGDEHSWPSFDKVAVLGTTATTPFLSNCPSCRLLILSLFRFIPEASD